MLSAIRFPATSAVMNVDLCGAVNVDSWAGLVACGLQIGFVTCGLGLEACELGL